MSQRVESKSFWLESHPAVPEEPLRGEVRVDVAVVGGGFAGLSTALHLRRKEPGRSVAVLEAEQVGFGASGRNAGFAMTLFGFALSLIVKRFGRVSALEAHRFMVEAVDAIERLTTEQGLDCAFEKTGLLTVATSRAHERRLVREIDLAGRLGIEGLSWLDGPATRARIHSDAYRGARWEPHSALLDPVLLVRGLKRLAQQAGAVVYEDSPVIRLLRHGSGPVQILTRDGAVVADRVVLATNAWSASFTETASLQIPVFTYAALTEPLTLEEHESLGWQGREGVEDARCLIHYYRLTPDNRLLIGGGDAYCYLGGGLGRDRRPDTALDLQRAVRALFPKLGRVAFTHSWGGPVSVPLDFAPAMGTLRGDPRIVYSLGCVGHGVALMTHAGEVLSDLVLGRQTRYTDLPFVNRFVPPVPPEPLRYALAQSIRGGMKLVDYLDGRAGA